MIYQITFRASQSGNVNIVEILFDAGADGNIHNVRKNSSMYVAVHHNHINVVKCILEKCPEIVQVSHSQYLSFI